jgi:hypothetical protein
MDRAAANPLLVGLFFILRCLVPLVVMLGISYILKKLGFIQPPPPPPTGWDNGENKNENDKPNHSGGLAHGKA